MNNLFAFFMSFVIALGIASMPLTAYAENDAYKNVVLPKNQTINKDYFAAGETVILSGIVNGDAYVAGGTVIVDGVINGDLLAAGGTVTVRGKVMQDVRVAGGQVMILGDIGRNVTTVGGTVTIVDTAKIHGSLTAGAGTLTVLAPVGKGANIGAGQVTIDNTINGDVQAGVGQLALMPDAKVRGNLIYWSDKKASIDTASLITGSTTHNLPPKNTEYNKPAHTPSIVSGINPFLTFLSFLAALVVGLLLVIFMPVYAQQTAHVVLTKPFPSLGIGFLSIVLAPFLFVLLIVTVIGIPLDLILLSGFMIFIYLAKIPVGIAVGQKVFSFFNKKTALGWVLVIGLGIYYVLTMIPLLGFIFWMVSGLIGLGAIILQRKDAYKNLREKALI